MPPIGRDTEVRVVAAGLRTIYGSITDAAWPCRSRDMRPDFFQRGMPRQQAHDHVREKLDLLLVAGGETEPARRASRRAATRTKT